MSRTVTAYLFLHLTAISASLGHLHLPSNTNLHWFNSPSVTVEQAFLTESHTSMVQVPEINQVPLEQVQQLNQAPVAQVQQPSYASAAHMQQLNQAPVVNVQQLSHAPVANVQQVDVMHVYAVPSLHMLPPPWTSQVNNFYALYNNAHDTSNSTPDKVKSGPNTGRSASSGINHAYKMRKYATYTGNHASKNAGRHIPYMLKPFRASKQDVDGSGALGNGFYPILLNRHRATPISYHSQQNGPAVWHP